MLRVQRRQRAWHPGRRPPWETSSARSWSEPAGIPVRRRGSGNKQRLRERAQAQIEHHGEKGANGETAQALARTGFASKRPYLSMLSHTHGKGEMLVNC